MAKKNESSQSTKFSRPALLEGNRRAKLPVPVGKWVWPGAALGLALGTVWGAMHIEDQVDQAAPRILAESGIDPSSLAFKTSYRSVDVSGFLPATHSLSHVETVLATYNGATGVNIRQANASALESSVAATKPATSAIAVAPSAKVRIAAVVEPDALILSGVVPSQDHVDLLENAALQSSQDIAVINNLEVSGKPAKTKYAEESINNLAMIIANFDTDIINAHIDLDDDLLTGNITTASNKATDKVKAYLPTPMIGIITDSDASPVNTTATSISIKQELSALLAAQEHIPLQQVPASQWQASQRPTSYSTELELIEPEVVEQQIDDPTITAAIYEPNGNIQQNQITSLQTEIDQLEGAIRDQVVFAPGSNVLSSSATDVLDDIIHALQSYPDTSMEISGHTDSQSSASKNLTLSKRRADAVANYITSYGIASHRLIALGVGEANPIASNDTKAGRALNRRVEFRAY